MSRDPSEIILICAFIAHFTEFFDKSKQLKRTAFIYNICYKSLQTLDQFDVSLYIYIYIYIYARILNNMYAFPIVYTVIIFYY